MNMAVSDRPDTRGVPHSRNAFVPLRRPVPRCMITIIALQENPIVLTLGNVNIPMRAMRHDRSCNRSCNPDLVALREQPFVPILGNVCDLVRAMREVRWA